jgi:predicted dehydrogenase
LSSLRIGVVGAGAFGRNHLRVLRDLPDVEITGVTDIDPGRTAAAAADFACPVLPDLQALVRNVDAAVVAVPTTEHARVGCELLESGLDVLVEKPIASDLASAQRLADTARRTGRVLQVGHLERFNPAVQKLGELVTVPLFFEIHRMSVFTPRSLDVDVVLDLMIHDIDIVLSLTGALPQEIRAAGISILSERVDIANVRLAFENGCVANLTASRVSTEKIRKIRLFQPSQYISLDYQKQEVVSIRVTPEKEIALDPVSIMKREPLRVELEHFVDCIKTRKRPIVGGDDAVRALQVSLQIADSIQIHAAQVRETLQGRAATVRQASPS